MRVMLVAGSFPPRPCGVGDYIARLAQALAALEGVSVAVVTQQGARMDPLVKVEVLGSATSWRLQEMAVLLRRIRQWKPDIVHIHYPSQGFYGRLLPALLPLACRLYGLKVVQTWHEAWPLRAAPRLILQRAGAHGLVFVRPSYMELLPRWLRPIVGNNLPQATVGGAGALPVSRQSPPQRQALRQRYLQGRQKLVVFFGFLYPSKGVEQLFEIADPTADALVIAGASNDPAYLRKLRQAAQAQRWDGHVHYTGFLPEGEAADLLAAADAVVLPFLAGAGEWNSSVHGALTQGTLVITTSERPTGDDADRNLYTARIADVDEMRSALRALAGRRAMAVSSAQAWADIAASHRAFYDRVLQSRTSMASV